MKRPYETFTHRDLLVNMVFDCKTSTTYTEIRLGKRPQYYKITKRELQKSIYKYWDFSRDSIDQIAEIPIIMTVTKWLNS